MHSPSKWLKFIGLMALKALSVALLATLVMVAIVALVGFVAIRAHAQTGFVAVAEPAAHSTPAAPSETNLAVRWRGPLAALEPHR